MNEQCKNCPSAHNSINGRYCNVFDRYVDYFGTPLCNNINPQIQPAL